MGACSELRLAGSQRLDYQILRIYTIECPELSLVFT